ncbi:Malonyl CoA-acyl carrier protein transacylase [Candidatus Clavichlamydia salmonicola]|uniref:ACP S-malonyltransferase n=1 Tax=Candidatus Clavichlamydia salmonicola TaxID=469812 RepID=UPI001E38C9E7|nr:ACP S-malonyltransferase [Candidatus Clavichlamydia salmonicola]MBF5051235.1 Malonyl CoA-acyl carrier protein transacylase [Candidatus Clavichlamydia salmonicola]
MKNFTFLFPGQGAQYVGMGADFFSAFSEVQRLFEQAEDILKRKLKNIVFEGPESLLKETNHSQIAIYLNSMSILSILQKEMPHIIPTFCAGLSLGEYSALTAASYISFIDCLSLIDARAKFMVEACRSIEGTMAAVMGLSGELIENSLQALKKQNQVWIANFNSPVQTVISGTIKGVEHGTKLLIEAGAKKIIPLKVDGAFHSPLMQIAQDRLREVLAEVSLSIGNSQLVMNKTGGVVNDIEEIRDNLAKHVTSPVRWVESMSNINKKTDLFIEIGCGKTLMGLNKQIGVKAPTLNLNSVEGLKDLFVKLENF